MRHKWAVTVYGLIKMMTSIWMRKNSINCLLRGTYDYPHDNANDLSCTPNSMKSRLSQIYLFLKFLPKPSSFLRSILFSFPSLPFLPFSFFNNLTNRSTVMRIHLRNPRQGTALLVEPVLTLWECQVERE